MKKPKQTKHKSRALVLGYFERIAGKAFEEFPRQVTELIGKQHGIYALYKGDRLYYVGLATNLKGRIKKHLSDRHKGKWDRFSLYLVRKADHIKELESLLLRIMSPKGNIQGGRFQASENLNPVMNKRIREFDAERRRGLVPAGRSGRSQNAVSGKRGARSAATSDSIVPRNKTLRAWNRDWQYRAVLHPSGRVTYDGKKYESPSAAALAATGTGRNGWRFWHYRDSSGEWVPISDLRR